MNGDKIEQNHFYFSDEAYTASHRLEFLVTGVWENKMGQALYEGFF